MLFMVDMVIIVSGTVTNSLEVVYSQCARRSLKHWLKSECFEVSNPYETYVEFDTSRLSAYWNKQSSNETVATKIQTSTFGTVASKSASPPPLW